MRRSGTHGKRATRLCPCGHFGEPSGRCRCAPDLVERYRSRVSGPLLDRIDLHVDVARVPASALRREAPGETSASVRARVVAARTLQLARAGKPNGLLANAEIERHCVLQPSDHALLERAAERLGLSARAYHRIVRVARTIADLAGEERIATAHLTEAIGYRRLDRSTTPEQ